MHYVLLFLISHFTAQSSVSQRIDSHIHGYYNRGDFSGVVLVARDGDVIYEGAFGYADAGIARPNRVETQFLIGSTTKSFTAITAMQLVEAGKLDLHEPISTYLPDLAPTIAKDMTMHILLKQLSGLPSSIERITPTQPRDIDHQEMVDIISNAEMRFNPGEKYAYSNVAYNLAACVLCRVAGMEYDELMETYCFKPLGMSNTGVERIAKPPTNKAVGYVYENDRLVRAEPHDMAYAMGSGDIYSTVGDLLKWDQALYGTEYISDVSKALVFSPADEDGGYYGYGFRIVDYKRADGQPDGKLARHGGSMRGYLANVHRYLDDRVTVIVLGNMRPYPIRDMCFEVKEIAFGRTPGKRIHE